ncbi:MAG TPA: tRNA uridine-5-carboxymethylaminomethyl(34) synthesis GTPase MnmE [Oscillospiraceae bacterium]|nr:tRNA uridine-5-carboxymethylaminomethyl(34) synthesis GTPase MnmE [Oscillospiraceae bacterium]
MFEDTIAAISTPPGEGGIGIVRISGPQAEQIGRSIFSFAKQPENLLSHHLYYGKVVNPLKEQVIDEALISFMRAPHTFTREDVVEVNCHGGIMPLSKTLALILAQGARLAEPGEFTQRAFLNGRIDLAQAEAVIQIIRAKTEAAMLVSVRQLTGHLSQEVKQIRRRLLAMLAHVEASIDFPEHQDVEDLAREEIANSTQAAFAQLEALLATAEQGRILREGIKTAIVGLPNVGKSSLLNALLREQRAIVTEIPGTTRDVLEESINLGGIALTIVDTAGIRETRDEIEKIGVQLSRSAIDKADLVLLVLELTAGLNEENKLILQIIKDKPCIIIANKTDLAAEPQAAAAQLKAQLTPLPVVPMSVLKQQGLQDLEDTIIQYVFKGAVQTPDSVLVTSTRHKNALLKAKNALYDLQNALEAGYAVDLLAIDLHAALDALGEITGESVGPELVDEIFSSFCIGK